MLKYYTNEELMEISPSCNCSPIIEIGDNIIVFDADGDGVCQTQISKNGRDWKLAGLEVYKLPCLVKLSETKIVINQDYKYLRFVTNQDGQFTKCNINC